MTAHRATFGIILILLGVIFLLNSTDVVDLGDMIGYLIPLGFITLGVWLIIRRRQRDEADREEGRFQPPPQGSAYTPPPGQPANFSGSATWSSGRPEPPASPAPPSAAAWSGAAGYSSGEQAARSFAASGEQQQAFAGSASCDSKICLSKLFGDLNIDLRDQIVQNAEISAAVGDIEIRLAGARLSGGLSRMIVSNFIGDIRIYAPHDMALFVHCSSFVGDTEALGRRSSGFGNNLDVQTADYATAEKRLYIAANLFIGDIKVFPV